MRIDEINILKGLAKRVREISELPEMEVRKARWYNHNSLKSERPLILCFPENAWNELIPQKELQCTEPIFRSWEYELRQRIYTWDNLRDDNVVTGNFDICNIFYVSDYNIPVEVHKTNAIDGAYSWDTKFDSLGDLLNKIKHREFVYNKDETGCIFELAKEVFGDILNVRLRGPSCFTFGLSVEAIKLTGFENFMLYMYDEPENLHKLMEFLMKDNMMLMDFLEKERLVAPNNENDYIPSGGIGYTNEIGSQNKQSYTFADMWGFADSQETVSVSPQAFNEFVFTYQKPLLERMGLLSYGCCEPLDNRWNYIKEMTNLRRVSVSPWADQQKMADFMGNKYIYARKPNPAYVCSGFDEEIIRKDLKNTLSIARNCNLEIILKDTHTIHIKATIALFMHFIYLSYQLFLIQIIIPAPEWR